MKKGLLWYDDSGRGLEAKVAGAARRYRRKFRSDPDTCYVHPSMLKDGKSVNVDGVRVVTLPTVLRHHFWLGREGKRRADVR